MKTYKVNGIIVKGNTCLDAISKIKDDSTSDIPNMLNMAKDYAKGENWQVVANICWSIADRLKRAKLADSIRDSLNNDSGKCFYTQRKGVIYVYIDYNLVGKFSSKKEAIDAGYDIDGAIKFNANYETK